VSVVSKFSFVTMFVIVDLNNISSQHTDFDMPSLTSSLHMTIRLRAEAFSFNMAAVYFTLYKLLRYVCYCMAFEDLNYVVLILV
jgi:hypothetical protein